MAQVNIGEEQNPIITTEPIQAPESIQIPVQDKENDTNEDETILPPSDKIVGLSEEELRNPNNINIEVADQEAPIVVLYGPAQCGKTMTLVRLTRYLSDYGYTVEPVREFRPTYDSNYAEICDNFDDMMNQDDAAKSTGKISFMLVKISKKGRTICQILEAPGEYYFNPKVPNSAYPKYFTDITSSNNRKIWCIFVEPKWGEKTDRKNYVTRIEKLKKKIKRRDRTIIVYNKIDETNFLLDGDGNVAIGRARKDISDRYTGLFDKFINTTPIIRLFSPYKCDFIPFQSGDYPETKNSAGDTISKFSQGPDVFPRKLWKMILSKVRG